jgi:hypothetical protein
MNKVKLARFRIWKKYGGRCAYCGNEIELKDMQIDHVHPKANGGGDEEVNLMPSCRACNFYKGTFSLSDFKQQLSTISERIKKPFIVRLAMKYGMIQFKPFSGRFYFEEADNIKTDK